MKPLLGYSCVVVLILLAATVLLDARPTDIRVEPEDVVGTYLASDGMVSIELTIRSDGTFRFYSEGGVPLIVTEGMWRLVAPGLIITNSEETQPLSEIRAEIDSSREKLTVVVKYSRGDRLPGATVTVTCVDGATRQIVSRKDGTASLDRCPVSKIDVAFAGFEPAVLSPEMPMANQFFVQMRESVFLLEDQLWYVHEGSLYRLENPLVRK
jgi:hypothetical protein